MAPRCWPFPCPSCTADAAAGSRRHSRPLPRLTRGASSARSADRQAHGGVPTGDRGEIVIQPPVHRLFGRRLHRVSSSGVIGTRAWAAAGSSIASSETPIPKVRNAPTGVISMTLASDRRSAGTRETQPVQQRAGLRRSGRAHDRRAVEADGRQGNGRHQRQDPAPAHQHRHRDPAVGRDMPRIHRQTAANSRCSRTRAPT